MNESADTHAPEGAIAVVSLSGRFPGADGVERFWHNLLACEDSISRFSAKERPTTGPGTRGVDDARFVGAEGVLGDIALFDAEFFGYSPREAAVMDPQHRLCLETAWQVFDTAGYDPAAVGVPVGVFLASSLSSYLIRNVLPEGNALRTLGGLPLLLHNDKDFAATTVSHRLGLTGPSYAVGSACSSSLVGVHLAVQSLLAGECDMALAGGVSLQVPQAQGYVYAEDGIYSPDGRCAPFDAAARGTVGGSGIGLVLLKRLVDAERDGDQVHAVILGSAVNNDGAAKVGYTAPSVTGQSAVVAEALGVAGVPAGTLGYVEAHGTGTSLGDPVEVEALTRAFGPDTGRFGFCALGSVKANVGHLDAAAGITGLMKAVLAVREGTIPGNPHYRSPNPAIDFATTPFYVNTETIPWPETGHPRRAGVSSFGIGGTNAHVTLEEPPPATPRAAGSQAGALPLVLSARTPRALAAATRELARWTQDPERWAPGTDLVGLAATLGGRRAFPHRAAVVCSRLSEAGGPLAEAVHEAAHPGRKAVFLFPGQGAALAGLKEGLYADEPVFRAHFDTCAQLFAEQGTDLGAALRTTTGGGGPAGSGAQQATAAAQPALFAVEYALGRTLTGWGLRPAAMLGHSLGEYAAAALAGVFSLPEAVTLVQARAAVQSQLPAGHMLAVSLTPEQVRSLLEGGLEIAAYNAPDRCVVSGAPQPVRVLAARLAKQGVPNRLLSAGHAFHSAAVEPLLDAFRTALARVTPQPPQVPYVSSLTGDWADAAVTTPEYWLAHMRQPVRFEGGLRRCLELGPVALLETGPSAGLVDFARRHTAFDSGHRAVRCLTGGGAGALTGAVADVWRAGCEVDWGAYHRHRQPRRITVPGYPFQRERYWLDAPDDTPQAAPSPAAPDTKPALPALAAALSGEQLRAPSLVKGIDELPGLRTGLNALCGALAREYLETSPEEQRILPEFRRFSEFLRTVAATAGPERPEEAAARIVERHPSFAGLTELLVHCAGNYPRALTVPGAALGVLYPEGGDELLRRTLGEGTAEHRATGRLTELAGSLLDRLAADRGGRLRVLEVGAGEGGLTKVLTGRAPGRLEYHATDISRLFVSRLGEEAARRGLDFVRTRVLDIAQDPSVQGFSGEHFDVVCGLDVLHATPDLREGMGHLRSLLAPRGVLALIETVANDPWTPMIWGLTGGWWSYTDQRTHGPLLDAAGWRALLAERDFAASEVLEPSSGPRDAVLVLAEQGPLEEAHRSDAGRVPRRSGPGEWSYLPGWRHASPASPAPPAGECLLIGEGELADAVTEKLEALGVAATTLPAVDGADEGPGAPDLVTRQLVTGATRLVVHLSPLQDALRRGQAASAETVNAAQGAGLHALLQLGRALGAVGEREPVRLVSVTAGAQEVLGDDLAYPEHATVAAAVKVMPREYPWLACTAMDVEPGARTHWLATRIVEELLAARETTTVAYRGRRRFTPCYLPHPLPPVPTGAGPRPGGVYLVCGGLGGLGLNLAEHLARTPATVVLTHRRPFPAREEWDRLLPDHPEAPLVRRLRGMIAAGGEVVLHQADLTDRSAMHAVVEATERDHGPVSGVVHAAGVPDTAGMIQRRDRAATDAAIASKVLGTLVLDELFAHREPDFMVLCSSIGTVLHKLKFGEVGYVAGNEFLNAFAAHRAASRSGRTLAIAWTDWLESGMWASAQHRLADRYGTGGDAPVRPGDDLLGGLTPQQGTEIFSRLLAAGTAPHALVSTQDLDTLLARHDAYTTDDHLAALGELSISGSGRARAGLSTRYEPPGTPVQDRIARWGAELLGFERVGITDDFFELGGDSLLALRLLSMLRDAYGVEISVARMFQRPTVAALAEAVDQRPGVSERPRPTGPLDPPGPTEQEEVLL